MEKEKMVNKHIELFKLIQENPELPIVPMVYSEVCGGDDYSFWMGSWVKCSVDEYYCGDERIYFKSVDYEDLVQELIDDNYEGNWKLLTDNEMDKAAEDIVDNYNWIKCITVRIELPN